MEHTSAGTTRCVRTHAAATTAPAHGGTAPRAWADPVWVCTHTHTHTPPHQNTTTTHTRTHTHMHSQTYRYSIHTYQLSLSACTHTYKHMLIHVPALIWKMLE